MLRWCLSTLHTLDGRGSASALNLWRYSPTPQVAILNGFLPRFATSRIRKFIDPRGWNRPVTWHITARLYVSACRAEVQYTREVVHHHHASVDLQVKNGVMQPAMQRSSKLQHILQSKASTLHNSPSIAAHLHSVNNHDKSNPIANLQQLLSRHNPREGRDISDIVSFYESAAAESTLSTLDAEQFTNLLSLIGSLSLSLHKDTLTVTSHTSSEKADLWAFVLKIGEDKEKLGYELNPLDRYWVMTAWLARARVPGVKARAVVRHARSQYNSLKTLTDDPNIHIPYLKFLASSANHKHAREAILSLCEILQRVLDPHATFVELLWEIILSRAEILSTELKERVIEVVFGRIYSRHNVETPSTSIQEMHDGTLQMAHLSRAFSAALFPCYVPGFGDGLVDHWAIAQARQAFAPTLPLDIRWSNLTLLALSVSPKHHPLQCKTSTTASPDSGNSLWRTTLVLKSLERKVTEATSDAGRLRQTVQGISKRLWDMFVTVQHAEQPINITLAYVATFFRIAALSYDDQLKEECFRLSQQLQLWQCLKTDSPTTRAQVVDNIAAFATAFVSCEGRDWATLYTTILSQIPDLDWQTNVTESLLQYYTRENVSIAYDLYVHGIGIGINISSQILNDLFLGFVKYERWDIVTLFLEHPITSRDQIEILFGESIRAFQVHRYEYAHKPFVKLLAETASKLYATQRPPSSLKYPLRYFFSMMIWTQNTSELVNLIQAIYRTAPAFFTKNVIRRLLLQLLHRQDLSTALDLFYVFEMGGRKSTSLSLTFIRHILFLRFMKLGAHHLAKRLSPSNTSVLAPFKRGTQRNAFRSHRLRSISIYLHPNLLARDNYTPTPRVTIPLLVQHKHFFAARKLYAKFHSQLDPKARTAIGNIIIHGLVHGQQFRQGRLVRHMLRTKDLLAKDYGFVPDRATVNIILKAILRWTSAFDAKKVRNLFDALVHEGYPVAERFRRNHGVPFSSPRSLSGLDISSLPVHISFSKHIRPMYRMFIKTFFLHGDVSAAKTVVGILKEEERKLDDAFQILDRAVTPSRPSEGPPTKKINTIRSFYSTLAKYGIKSPNQSASSSNIPSTAKSTPHLTAILNRAASKTKSAFSFKFSSQSNAPPLPATAEYRPSSLSSFLSRLGTYKLTTYANKPPSVDAVAASKCGWINDGKDRLVCGICNASWVVAGREGLSREAANALTEKQRVGLVGNHKNGCPWRTHQCEDSIYRIPLHSPVTMVRDLKASAVSMDPLIKNIDIKHPLTTSQLNALCSTVAFYKEPASEVTKVDDEHLSTQSTSPESEPSETATLAALFGWALVSSAPPEPRRRISTHTNSVASSIPPSPPSSRASSVSLSQTPPKPRLAFRLPSTLILKPENALLQCQFCQRRIGLWTFSLRTSNEESTTDTPVYLDTVSDVPTTPASRPKKTLPRRSLDLLKEHRSYCPYVVRSTAVPSLPVPPTSPRSNGHAPSLSVSQFNGMNGASNALEGWRAILTVILRYGMAQKQRIEYNFLVPKDSAERGDQDSEMDVDNVKAMITGVKTRGGKDLLKYVKGLLG
ncbi:hypothetical protein CPB84DRAFT_1962574 [Gymnopilus junonius]|uniref:Uncharacterized protein n=1 Tax=Gymnopilus junonius TaxID=109634 RepID=A0A9P5TLT2_GYMJU|nr:hypothetical protein CPB84DRAFT_1962574 [Gymnopilus junonius]